MNENLKIKNIEISKLNLNPIHARIYQINDIDDLVNSIKEVGLLENIVVDQNYTIISGVRRLMALKILGYTHVDVEVKEINEGDELLTLISFNKQRIKTNRELLSEMKFLKEIWGKKRGRKSQDEILANSKMSGPVDTRNRISKELNISTGNLSKLEYIDRVRTDLIDEIDKNKVSIDQVYTILKKNEEVKKIRDIKTILPTTISNTNYTIYNESSDNLSQLSDKSIQCIICSPPYYNLRSYSEVENELGSEKTPEEYIQRMANHLHACYRVLKDEGSFFLNMGDTFVDKNLQNIPHRVVIELQKKSWILRNTIIWKKLNKLPGTSDNLTCSYEFIFHLVKSKDYYFNPILIPNKSISPKGVRVIKLKDAKFDESNFGHIHINGLTKEKRLEDFWTEDIVMTAGVNQKIIQKYGIADHPAPYPVCICIIPILQTSRPGDIVLDVFSGSGSTGEAAILLGRKYVGYETVTGFNEGQKNRLDKAIKKYNDSQALKKLSQAA